MYKNGQLDVGPSEARGVRSPLELELVIGSSEVSVVGVKTHTLKVLQILNHGAISPAPTME